LVLIGAMREHSHPPRTPPLPVRQRGCVALIHLAFFAVLPLVDLLVNVELRGLELAVKPLQVLRNGVHIARNLKTARACNRNTIIVSIQPNNATHPIA
jgi:uncharacterized lipoprotein YddW (UPF0748 family)